MVVNMRKNKILIIIAVLATGLIMSQPVNAQVNKAMDGVTLGNVNVSGRSYDEINTIAAAAYQTAADATISVHCVDDGVATFHPSEMGIEWKNEDIAKDIVDYGKKGNVIARYKAYKDLMRDGANYNLKYEFDKNKLRDFVAVQSEEYSKEAQNVSLEKTEGGFNIIDGQSGVVIDVDEASEYLYEYLVTEWNGESCDVDLPVKEEQPKGSREELEQVKDVLATFTTSFKTSGADRSTNVTNGCRLVDGTTLYPGEEFSMYDTIKPFSEENGYRMAGSYVNGMVVDSLGGGICQVSTTLYNAVLRAELEVVERNNHSMIVNYVDASADAAISESAGKDFRFVNNTDYPIYIEGYTTTDKKITFNIYGKETRPDNRAVDYVSEVLETTQPDVENIIPSSQFPVGYCTVQSAHIGYKAQLVKIVTVDGKEESREVVNSSTYKMVPRTAVVGIVSADPEATSQINDAIATGSIDYVRGVAASWAAASAQVAAQQAQAQAQAAGADGQ